MRRTRILFLAGVIGIATACTSSSGSGDPKLDGLKSALAGQPDAPTRAATRTLAAVLNVEEWGYLTYAQWPDDDGLAAIKDPTLRKAIDALARADGFAIDVQSVHPGAVAGITRPQALPPGVSEVSFDPAAVAALNHAAVFLMEEERGLAFAGNPDAAAAWTNLLYQTIKTTSGSPLPDRELPADRVLDGCGKYWAKFPEGTMGPGCSPIDFCCRGTLEYDDKKLTRKSTCFDFTSCRGMVPLPLMTDIDDGDQDGTGGSGGNDQGSGGPPGPEDNVCFVGDGVAVDPAPWVAACEKLDPMTTAPITCLDAVPALHVGAPVLPNGKDPSRVCKVFMNEDGIGTPLGESVGCDHESGLNVTCYCCPAE